MTAQKYVGANGNVELRSKVQYMLIELARKSDAAGYEPGDEIGYLDNIFTVIEEGWEPRSDDTKDES